MHKLYTNRGRDINLVVKRPYLKFRGRFLPIVSIWLKCNDDKEWVEFKAFVDSGAAYSVFQAEMAEILGLSLEDGKMEYMTVGDGSQINVYIHKVRCKLADLPDEPASEEFEATIGFSRHLGIGFNIIGRMDIFDRFKICFDESEKTVEFYVKE